jgi:hypothetical protein
LTFDFFLSTFGVSAVPFIVVSILFHIVNSLLLWRLLYRFGIHPVASYIGGFFFGIASAGHQALSWPGASLQTLGLTCFMLASVHMTLDFIQTKKYRYVFFAFLCSYVSFMWKPSGIITPVLIIIFILLNRKKVDTFQNIRTVAGIGGIVLCTVFSIVFYRFLKDSISIPQVTQTLWNAVLYPLVAFSQVFIPYRLMFRMSSWFTEYMYPQVFHDGNIETIEHFIISDYLSIVASMILIIGMIQLFHLLRIEKRKIFIFGIAFFVLQFTPIGYYWVNRGISYSQSRYVYPAIAGISILLGIAIEHGITAIQKQKQLVRYLSYIVCIGLCVVWLGKEMTVTRREVRVFAMQGTEIKKTWDSFQALPLPHTNKLIIYLKGNRTYYYPDNYLPFQQGSGYMLFLAFQDKSFIDKSFIRDYKLVAMGSNGYVEANGKKFGYYTDLDALVLSAEKKEIGIEEIFSYHFDDTTYGLRDITEEVRDIIRGRLRE